MELTTVYIWGSLGAAFCLVVGALIGHAIYDRQQMVANAVQREHLTAVDEKWHLMLEEANAQAEAATHSFEFSDKFRKAIVDHLVVNLIWDFDVHSDDPMLMLAEIIKLETSQALDPCISKKAKNLYVKGVRAGAKKGRVQMQKLMQKSIDNQAATIVCMYETLAAAHDREDIYREAVANTLTDKVGLVGVRRAIVQGIAAECTRLRAVEAKKGE